MPIVGTHPLFTLGKDIGGEGGQLGNHEMKPGACGYPFPHCWARETHHSPCKV